VRGWFLAVRTKAIKGRRRTARSGCAAFLGLLRGEDLQWYYSRVQDEKSGGSGRAEPIGYYERNLPHWQPEGRAVFLTWRLHGTLPRGFAQRLQKFGKQPERQFLKADLELDSAVTGPHWLGDPKIARCAEAAIRRGAALGHYVLHAYVVMPNHVHLLIEPSAPLRRITNGIKGASARYANRILKRTGKPFWQDESFDHWIRNEGQFEKVRAYVERNPVKAGLVTEANLWRWSSAYGRGGRI
jgi:putative transposase